MEKKSTSKSKEILAAAWFCLILVLCSGEPTSDSMTACLLYCGFMLANLLAFAFYINKIFKNESTKNGN